MSEWEEKFQTGWEKLAENLGSSVTSGDLREFSESFIRTELERQEKELVKKCDYAMREHAGELVKNVDKEVLRQVKAQKTELLQAKDAEWTIRCEKAIKENVERNIRAEGKRKDAEFKSVLEGLKMEKKVYLILATERDLPHFNQAVDLINSKISKAIKEIERKTR